MKDRTIQISLGAIAPKIITQLDEQGIVCDLEVIKHLQRDADAIARLSIQGFIPDAVAHTARKKLVKKIEKAIEDIQS